MFNDILGKKKPSRKRLVGKNRDFNRLVRSINFSTAINIAWEHLRNDDDLMDAFIDNISAHLNEEWGILEEDASTMAEEVMEVIFT